MMRLLAVIEAAVITGPAKNLLEFAGLARTRGVEVTVVAFARGSGTNAFIEAARSAATAVEIAPERRAFDRGVIPALREVVRESSPISSKPTP